MAVIKIEHFKCWQIFDSLAQDWRLSLFPRRNILYPNMTLSLVNHDLHDNLFTGFKNQLLVRIPNTRIITERKDIQKLFSDMYRLGHDNNLPGHFIPVRYILKLPGDNITFCSYRRYGSRSQIYIGSGLSSANG